MKGAKGTTQQITLHCEECRISFQRPNYPPFSKQRFCNTLCSAKHARDKRRLKKDKGIKGVINKWA